MGEIKSTLDIVMEKTKHLSMTTEEKLAKEKEDVQAAVRGLVQKYQDQILSLEMFQKELGFLHQQHTFEDNEFLVNEIFSRLEIEEDNSLLYELIKKVFHIDPIKLEDILNPYKDEINDLVRARLDVMKNDLKEKHSITGSAIIPNIDADSAWEADVMDVKNRFHSELDEAKTRILNS